MKCQIFVLFSLEVVTVSTYYCHKHCQKHQMINKMHCNLTKYNFKYYNAASCNLREHKST